MCQDSAHRVGIEGGRSPHVHRGPRAPCWLQGAAMEAVRVDMRDGARHVAACGVYDPQLEEVRVHAPSGTSVEVELTRL